MYEIIMNNEHINENFLYVMFDDNLFDGYVQLFPKDFEIIEYWKYFKRYGSLSGFDPIGKKDSYYFLYHSFLSKFHIFSEIPKYEITNIYNEDYYMKFIFPDEEEALYFKLKFC